MNDRIDGDTSAKKGRRTRRRAVALAERRTRGAALSSWLQDRLGLAQKATQAAKAARAEHDATAVALGFAAPVYQPEWVVEHAYPNRAMRRSGRGGGVFVRNTPYVNLSRDMKPGRRLRGDEQHDEPDANASYYHELDQAAMVEADRLQDGA